MPALTDNLGRPQSGWVPQAVIGLVEDNVDPDKLGRVKVKFPTLPEMPSSFWLRTANQNGGAERGTYSVPEVDDEVVVIFMQGSQDVGVVIGQLWNGQDAPPPEAFGDVPGAGSTDTGGSWSTAAPTDGSGGHDDNDRRIWRSRAGHLFMFEDTGGSESVQLWDNTHTMCLWFDVASETIILSNTGQDIHIRTGNDLYLEAGNDIKYYAGNNIEGEAVTDRTHTVGGNDTLEATGNIEFKATGNVTGEATGNMELKSTGTFDIKGTGGLTCDGTAQATYKSAAVTTVKGSLVMIN